MADRIDKIVSGLTGLSRREVRKAVSDGNVAVNGRVVGRPEFKCDPEQDVITFAGRKLEFKKNRYFLLNKPSGLLSASRDAKQPTVLDLFRNEPNHASLFTVGRLDKDTTGLLIVTDDGEFAHRVISPKSRVEKEYAAVVDGDFPTGAAKSFADGVVLTDGTRCLPAELRIIGARECRVTVYEGKYHQVKRMIGTLGLGVVTLERLRIGGITLPEVRRGEYIEKDRAEMEKVFK